jgi:ribosomal protein L2
MVSNIVTKKKICYIKSSGTFGIIRYFNKSLYSILVELPSGQKKFFAPHSICSRGRNNNIFSQKQIFFKNSIKLKKKSIVRGVAMNPVDHKNGGRTKSKSPELSIWG